MKKETLVIIALGIGLIISFIVGRESKHCPKIVETKIDTLVEYVPLTGLPITTISFPINRPAIKPTIQPKNTYTPTVAVGLNSDGFISVDTLRFDSLFVAITDSGGCRGIYKRQSTFGGKLKQQTVTVTNTLERRLPFLQLYAGVQSSYSGKWRAVDFGPMTSLLIKQRHLISYSYLLASSTHNISLQTKLSWTKQH